MGLFQTRFRKVGIFHVLITFLFLASAQVFLSIFSHQFNQVITSNQLEEFQNTSIDKQIVAIGIVVCGSRESADWNLYINQASVHIKSVLISAEIYNVSEIHFHLFLENLEEDEQVFRNIFKDMGYPTRKEEKLDNIPTNGPGNVKVTLLAYSIKSVRVPEEFQSHMIYHKRFRCAYVRFYFPSALPTVDAIIYMDVDSVVTGSLADIWAEFSKMNSMQMVGSVNEMSPENDKFPGVHKWNVGEVPALTKHGYNNGFLWMNLTRMREFGWEERISRGYQDYSKFVKEISSQRIYNVLTYFSSDRTLTIPCQFNFAKISCIKGFFCKGAESDPLGIQIVHGNPKAFLPGTTFHEVYQRFLEFPFKRTNFSVDAFKKQVMEPLRSFYGNVDPIFDKNLGAIGECKRNLGRYLFPNFFQSF